MIKKIMSEMTLREKIGQTTICGGKLYLRFDDYKEYFKNILQISLRYTDFFRQFFYSYVFAKVSIDILQGIINIPLIVIFCFLRL